MKKVIPGLLLIIVIAIAGKNWAHDYMDVGGRIMSGTVIETTVLKIRGGGDK